MRDGRRRDDGRLSSALRLAAVPRFEPGPESARAWLFAIARHKFSEALRSSRIQDDARRALAMQPIQLDDEAIEILETTARAAAVELLETLAPEQRDAIKAHHVEDRGYAEIAVELRCSESVIPQASEPRPGRTANPTSKHPAPAEKPTFRGSEPDWHAGDKVPLGCCVASTYRISSWMGT